MKGNVTCMAVHLYLVVAKEVVREIPWVFPPSLYVAYAHPVNLTVFVHFETPALIYIHNFYYKVNNHIYYLPVKL
jgi:hypothetical protein